MTDLATTLDRPLSAVRRSSLNLGPVGVAAGTFVIGAADLMSVVSWRQAALFFVGGAAGVVLYHAAFGFTSAWRVFITDRRGAGIRAQMLMLGVTCLVFFPVLAAGHFWSRPVRGFVSPIAVSVVVGAFLFGVGMQLGGGCASGTLYTRNAGVWIPVFSCR